MMAGSVEEEDARLYSGIHEVLQCTICLAIPRVRIYYFSHNFPKMSPPVCVEVALCGDAHGIGRFNWT